MRGSKVMDDGWSIRMLSAPDTVLGIEDAGIGAPDRASRPEGMICIPSTM